MTVDNSQSFKHNTTFVGKTADVVNNISSSVKYTKIIVPLNFLMIFWESSEMPLINCKADLELNWIEDCIWSGTGDSAKFKTIDAKLSVLVVTLSTKDYLNFIKQLSGWFKIWSIEKIIRWFLQK